MDFQRIIVIIFILIMAGGGYYYFQVYNAVPTPEGGSTVVADLDARLTEIRPLASVELDTSLFDNAFFRSLKPLMATTGPSVLPGRLNPFTPY